MAVIDHVLERARWAPSGDNTQPWRFQRIDDSRATIFVEDTRAHVVYDLDGHATEIALGALLETLDLAASEQGWRAAFTVRDDVDPARCEVDVVLAPAPERALDPLAAAIETRAVYRKPLSSRALTPDEHQALARATEAYALSWQQSGRERRAMAALNFHSAHIRLTTPEAWAVHRSVIEWNAQFSIDKIPDQAVGADPMLRRVMRWVLQDWSRVRFANRFLAGTLMPRIELDWLPSLACAGHVALVAPQEPTCRADFIAAGRAVQRLWLQAECLGLRLQPEMTPVIFARYAREQRRFSGVTSALRRADQVAADFAARFGASVAPRIVFLGRVGAGPRAHARSLRLSLETLSRRAPAQ